MVTGDAFPVRASDGLRLLSLKSLNDDLLPAFCEFVVRTNGHFIPYCVDADFLILLQRLRYLEQAQQKRSSETFILSFSGNTVAEFQS